MSDDIYKEEILEHYWEPHNSGTLPHPQASAEEVSETCGDKIRIDLAIDKGGRITDVRFTGAGCAISQASTSMLTDKLKGLTITQAQKLSEQDILAILKISISPARQKCALLGWQVMKKALRNS